MAEPGSASIPASRPVQPVSPQVQATKVERMLVQMVIRHGERVIYHNVEDEEGNLHDLCVARFIKYSLDADGLSFRDDLYNHILSEAVDRCGDPNFVSEPYFIHHHDIRVSQVATEMASDDYGLAGKKDELPLNDADRQQREENELESLRNQVMHLLLDFRMDYVEQHLKDLVEQIKAAASDMERLKKLMEEYRDMQDVRNNLAKQLGNNIIV